MTDNSRAVLRRVEGNIGAALDAMGTAAVGIIVRQMQSGYGKPIRQTGNLMRDVQYETDLGAKVTRVGNTLDYSIHVHDGTYKMPGRAYMSDSLPGAVGTLAAAAEPHLKQGF
jgi:hypothetical protein